jgi:hypothetical protein
MAATGPLVTVADLRAAIDTPASMVPDSTLQTICDVADRVLLPLLTDEDHSDPVDHAHCHEAALGVAVQVWQSRSAPGGQMIGTDLGSIPAPYLAGPGLVTRFRGLLGDCEPYGGGVFG